MIKSLAAIATATLLLLGLGIYEWRFVQKEFGDFREELTVLYEKTERGDANGEDAKAVQTKWESRKKRLHIWIPHNDISRIDDYMAETVRYVAEEEDLLALAKLEIMLHLSECIPGTYAPNAENIF